jgi:hypothetical protein
MMVKKDVRGIAESVVNIILWVLFFILMGGAVFFILRNVGT